MNARFSLSAVTLAGVRALLSVVILASQFVTGGSPPRWHR